MPVGPSYRVGVRLNRSMSPLSDALPLIGSDRV